MIVNNWKIYLNPDKWHWAARFFPILEGDEKRELIEDIRAKGLQESIVLHQEKVLDGRNRLLACAEIDLTPSFVQWQDKGLSPLEWVISKNIKRRHLTASQRAGLAAKFMADKELSGSFLTPTDVGEGKIREKFAHVFGVSAGYIQKALKLPSRDVDALIRGDKTIPGTYAKVVHTGENEWYTPTEYLELARKVLDQFDLDPASSDRAQESVKAKLYFTKETNGLEQSWHGRIWLNPPYIQPDIEQFIDKLVYEYSAGHTIQAILLTHNYTDTTWFHKAATTAKAICFTRGRIKFINAAGNIASPSQGQAFFYFGDDIKRFNEIFRGIGIILTNATK